MDYTIQVVSLYGHYFLRLVDNETGEYLNQRQLEEWVEYIGGFEIKRYYH